MTNVIQLGSELCPVRVYKSSGLLFSIESSKLRKKGFYSKALNPRIYKIVLIISSLFMIGFGIYLSIRIIIFPPEI